MILKQLDSNIQKNKVHHSLIIIYQDKLTMDHKLIYKSKRYRENVGVSICDID